MCLIASYCTVCKQHESISRVQPSSVPAILQSSGESYFIATESNVADMRYLLTASLKVMKIFSHLQTGDQNQKVQNDKLSQGNVETKIFVGGNGNFSHFLGKKMKKIWKKIFNFFFFLLKFVFLSQKKHMYKFMF